MRIHWSNPRLSIAIKTATVILALTGCGQPTAKQSVPQYQPISIGVILPMTGRLAMMGEVERNAMTLAATEINAGGERVILRFEDGKGNAKDAVAAANKLLDIGQVDVLITSTTGASLAVQPIAAAKQRNQVAFCMDPDVAKGSEFTTRLYIGIDDEAKAITAHFSSLPNPKRVAILYAKIPAFEKVVNNTYLPSLNAAGHDVSYVESYEVAQTDFRSLVLKLDEAKPDYLLLIGYGFEYPNIYREMQTRSMTGRFTVIGGWGFLYTPLDKTLLEGTLVSGPEYVFQNKEQAARFRASYQSAYGQHPNFDAAFAYEVIRVLARALPKDKIALPLKLELGRTDSLSGAAGTFELDQDGNMIVGTTLGVYRDGHIEPYNSK